MMASSSSCSSSTNIGPQVKYDVFLSFRDEDTRDKFTSHLYAALLRKKIETFMDNQLLRGGEIAPSPFDAIERSKISIVIFSQGYASSRWCLEELVKILECKDKHGQIVIPVFYYIDPSNVRNQSGIFGDAFLELEERFKDRSDELERWKIALREAANLSGFDSCVIRPDSLLVEEIVKDILKRLNDSPTTYNKGLVGVESILKEIESLLSIGSKDVYTLGIWGIGGIGKTTIASAIFNKLSQHFEGSCFIQNVREESEKGGGLAHLQQVLLSTIVGDGNVNMGIPNMSSNFRSKRLSRMKVLIVFDDVTNIEQIEFLVGGLGSFMLGSRIIITTRDKQVLKNCRVDKIYEVKELFDGDALQLFSRYAFGQNYPDLGYMKLSYKVIKYAQGVPLALKVLGCFLFSRRKEEWESTINKLEKSPHKDIQRVLKVSYDSLDNEEQNIFLDIACFFKGEDRDFVLKFLDASGFPAEIGISVLVDKSLIFISKNKICMHDLLQEMGREIVRYESIKNPGRRSRLWHHEDIYHVLTKNMGTEAIEGISLDMSKIKDITLNPHTFTKMHNLRFFKFYSSLLGDDKNKVHHVEGLESIFTELRYLHWHGYPLKSLSSYIYPENLVALEMPHSSIEQLWNDAQHVVNLKRINLSHSKLLTRLPDLTMASNLETLNLEGCTSLLETHSSIQYLTKLVTLNLGHCRCLKSLPTGIQLESLKRLILSGCSNLDRFPEISCTIEELYLDGTAIEELPPSIECLERLTTMNLENCSRLDQLPNSLCKLKCLQHLNLSGCSKLGRLPDEFGNLEALSELKADRTAISEVPSSIFRLNGLYRLSFERCKGELQMGLRLPIFLGLHVLSQLYLSDCGIKELPESLGDLSSLRILFLDKNNFERIPVSIICLSKLFWLNLSYCERLQSLPALPCDISDMELHCCSSLEGLSGLSILFTPTSWNSQVINFINCFKLDGNLLRKIIQDAVLKIQHIATAWQNEYHKENYETPSGCISFPGSEIPEWFSFQSTGSSITLELPPDWFDNFVGFTMCAIVSFRDHHDDGKGLLVGFECKLKTEDGDWHTGSGSLLCWGDGFSGPRDVGSDHIILGYDFAMYSDDFDEYCYGNEASIQFYLMDHDNKHIECCMVTKCAVHLLYSEDSEESIMEKPSTSSSSDEGDEPRPKRSKFFKAPLVDPYYDRAVFL